MSSSIKEIFGRRPFFSPKVFKCSSKYLIILGSLFFSAHFIVTLELVLLKKDVNLLRIFMEVTLACTNFQKLMFWILKKFMPPYILGCISGGMGHFFWLWTIFFWLWTIFLVMDHLKKVVTGTFSAFLRVF